MFNFLSLSKIELLTFGTGDDDIEGDGDIEGEGPGISGEEFFGEKNLNLDFTRVVSILFFLESQYRIIPPITTTNATNPVFTQLNPPDCNVC